MLKSNNGNTTFPSLRSYIELSAMGSMCGRHSFPPVLCHALVVFSYPATYSALSCSCPSISSWVVQVMQLHPSEARGSTSPARCPRSCRCPSRSCACRRRACAAAHLLAGQRCGRPPRRPRARAAANPAIVRSRMRSRSNSASAPMRWNTSLPPLVLVSRCSCRLRKSTPRSERPASVSMRCARIVLGGRAARRRGCHLLGRKPGLPPGLVARSCCPRLCQ